MKQSEKLLYSYNKLPLWRLVYLMANMEARIVNLIKAGETDNKSSKLRNLKWKRNVLRNALYEKLKLWREGKLDEKTPTYADLNKEKQLK